MTYCFILNNISGKVVKEVDLLAKIDKYFLKKNDSNVDDALESNNLVSQPFPLHTEEEHMLVQDHNFNSYIVLQKFQNEALLNYIVF